MGRQGQDQEQGKKNNPFSLYQIDSMTAQYDIIQAP